MITQDSQERRAYYRIRDRIALQISTGAPSGEDSLLFNLLNELYLLELESQPLLRSISEQQRTLVNYLKITNKRIDLLANALAQGLMKDFGEPQEVTLSEDGICFLDTRHHQPGSILTLRLILLPQAFGLQLQARIVNCQATGDRFKVAACFHEPSETQRQVLARHIMHKQAQERREALADLQE
ncbi:PilZ domain-containing protein [Thiopseudomonas denitrificans]|uniref:PilZ domain-containing protein n=1 Tax=Thiopseudomonas denitrificans TaxID=1501432 RepID=A0A4R6U470_9GAMM|nr:PilZ domain-containing protein [Thiopseudomonas denitrificans]TDQ40262.1 PilZ domain-containing protein [Thiopseudomonas denitrificans]